MKSEAAVQSEVRLRAGELGIRLWRNNVGACQDDTGRIIRYGLGNDSPQISKRLKSSDLIGIVRRNHLLDRHAGTVGVFLAVECKHEGWKFSPNDERAVAQLAFIDLVLADGGIAGFAQSVEDFETLLRTHGVIQ